MDDARDPLPPPLDGTRTEAERELQEARDLLRNVLDSSTEYSIFAEDLDGRIVLWNEGARRNYGYTADEIVGRSSDILVARGDPATPPPVAFQARALERGQIETIVRMRRKDGTSFTAKVLCTRRTGESGNAAGVLTISRDVTQEEQRLKEREILAWIWEYLASSLDYRETLRRVARLVIDLVGDACAVDVLRDDGSVERVAVLHADPSNAPLAQRLERFAPVRGRESPFWQVVDTRQPLFRLARLAAETLLPPSSSDEHGRLLEAMGIRSLTIVPLVSRDQLLAVLTVGSSRPEPYEPADRRLLEELARRSALAVDNALLYQQSRLQAAVTTNLAEGVTIIRVSDETIVYVNARFEQMFGYDPGELVGKHVATLNAGGTERAQEIIAELSRAGRWHGEIENVKKNGETFWCQASVTVFDHPEFGPVWIDVHTDITERKRLEEANIKSLEEKEVLLKEVHHRVKNNLQVISSLFYLQRQRVQDPQIKGLLDESRSRVESIALIHEQLYQSTSLADIDFDDYLRRLTAALVSTYGARQVRVETRAAGVVLDVEQAVPCALVISELVSNSLKHAFAGRPGKLWVRARPAAMEPLAEPGAPRVEGREVILDVGDDGVGIPESLDWRAAPSLGLQLVQSLVKQLRGAIELDRSAGTRFTIRFRISKDAPARARQLAASTSGADGSVK